MTDAEFALRAANILSRLTTFAVTNPWTGLADDDRSKAFVADARTLLVERAEVTPADAGVTP